MPEPFDPRDLRDWWKDPAGNPFKEQLKELFSAAIADQRKALRAEQFTKAYGHEVEAVVYEDVLGLVDGLIQDQAKEKDESNQERKSK